MANEWILDKEINDILNEFEQSKECIFLTGKGGSGKSTLLSLYRTTSSKKIAFLAPTGIAALHIKGQTIHSFFLFPPRLIHPGDIQFKFQLHYLKKLEAIVIDEISMVRADVLDAIDLCLKLHRKNNMPFGGVKMILVGDLFQLPPVTSHSEEKSILQKLYESPYFFSSYIWKEISQNVNYINLTKVFRQTDRNFINLLDEIRKGELTNETLDEINERYTDDFFDDKGYIYLSPRNQRVNQINEQKLNEINEASRTFVGKVTGIFPINLTPTDLTLVLKIGAQVIFLRNDTEKNYLNGTVGTVHSFQDDKTIMIEIPEKGIVKCSPFSWEMYKYIVNKDKKDEITPEIIGTFTQFPIRMAWAVTIHKSQGQTYEKLILDIGQGAFEHGQTYVALSRCRQLEGIILKKKIKFSDIIVDPRIVDFYQTFL